MQEMQETLFKGITQEEIDNFFGKPEPIVNEGPTMTSEEVEAFIKRVTFHPTSQHSVSTVLAVDNHSTQYIQNDHIEIMKPENNTRYLVNFNDSKPQKEVDPFEGSEIDMTEEEAEEFIKNFKMDFDIPKTKEEFSKSKSKAFKPKSVWSDDETEEIINLIKKMHPEKIYNNTKENDSYIMFTTIGTKHSEAVAYPRTYGLKVCDATNPIKLKEVLNNFPKENLGVTFNTFTHYKSKNKINSIFYVNNLVIDIDFKKAGYKNSDQVMFFLENDFFRKELPEPNFIEIGNQMKLIYTLEEPIKISKKSSGIKLFLKVVMNKLASKLKDFGADNISINYYIRVPGSVNTKNNSVVRIKDYSTYKWSFQDLVDEFLPSLPNWYKNKATLKKENKTTKKHRALALQRSRFNFINRSKIILSDLEKIQKRCNKIENSGHRELLCFLYRNYCLLAGFSSKEALLAMLKFNEGFNVPLIEKQVISHTNNVDRKQYKYSNILLMRELEITEQEALELDLEAIRGRKIYSKEEKSEYNHRYYVAHRQNDLSLKERVQKIEEVVLENKLKKVSNKAIRALLETVHKINLSLKSVERYVTKLIKKEAYLPI